jgi:ribosomal protein L11 methyltransferase
MGYLAYHFEVDPPQPGSDILIAMISEMGFESFDQSETGFTAYIKEVEKENVDLENLQFDDFTYTYSVEAIQTQNWNEEWERNFEPVTVDDFLTIRAPFHSGNKKVKHEIVIMPKMSFGTGHHQTTRLMCKQMSEMEVRNKRVLDMGCGTAVLAILAHKLGAKEILGIDIDEWSVENSMENCAANGCPDIIIKKGDVDLLENEKPFDIILANINKNILKAHIPAYTDKLLPGGRLLLSGFFVTDVEELKDVCEKNQLEFASVMNDNEWAMMVLRKG